MGGTEGTSCTPSGANIGRSFDVSKEIAMQRLRNLKRQVLGLPHVPQARHLAERAVAPYLRADVHDLAGNLQTVHENVNSRLVQVESRLDRAVTHVSDIGATASASNRLLRREQVHAEGKVADALAQVAVLAERIDALTAGFIEMNARLDYARRELMLELRYGGPRSAASARSSEIINEAVLEGYEGVRRVNLGCGHIPLEGFINVDMRALPGVDVVTTVDELPFEKGSLDELFSAHVLEHFPEDELRMKLLPYWISLLKPGGIFRAVVPDHEAMIDRCAKGEMSFEDFRRVTVGDQEYEGNFHYNVFTPKSLSVLLERVGLSAVTVVAAGRVNGLCLEFEIEGLVTTE